MESSGVLLALIVLLLAISAALGLCIRQLIIVSRLSQALQNRLSDLEAQLHNSVSGSVGMGKRIVKLEKKVQSLQSDSDERSSNVDEFAYGQALKMFEQGADVQTVASNCGFSNSEAQLMELIQKQLKQSPHTES